MNRWRKTTLGKAGMHHCFLICPLLTFLCSNISTAHSNIGYLFTLAINLSVLLPLQNDSFSNNLALCLTNSCELVCTCQKRCFVHRTHKEQTGSSLEFGGSFSNKTEGDQRFPRDPTMQQLGLSRYGLPFEKSGHCRRLFFTFFPFSYLRTD